MREVRRQELPRGRRAGCRRSRGGSIEPSDWVASTQACDVSRVALVEGDLAAGVVGKSVPVVEWLGGLGRWNAGQSYLELPIDDRPLARTSAK